MDVGGGMDAVLYLRALHTHAHRSSNIQPLTFPSKGQLPSLLLGHQKRLTYAVAQLSMAHPEWVELLSPGTRRLSLHVSGRVT